MPLNGFTFAMVLDRLISFKWYSISGARGVSYLFTLAHDGLLSIGTDGYDCDGGGKLFLKEVYVVDELRRELIFALHCGHVGLPQ